MEIGCHTITWGGVVGDPVGVTSVKDLFYRANGSMAQALEDIAAAGYAGVEMFDGNIAGYGEDVGRLRELLERANLQLISVYAGGNFIYDEILPEELHRIAQAADLARRSGATHLVVGGGARRWDGTRESDYLQLAKALDQVTDIAEDAGLAACYHPHLSTIVESPDEIERLLPHTRIGFCPDTAHLRAGGGDPATLIRRYGDRVTHVHLKDLNAAGDFVTLGEGEIDFGEVVDALAEAHFDGWAVVELDSYDGPPGDAARRSKEYLDQLLGSGPEDGANTHRTAPYRVSTDTGDAADDQREHR